MKPLFKHQEEAIRKGYGRKAFAYFLEPGLGKTRIFIEESLRLYRAGVLDAAVVVCPINALHVWEEEIEKWGGNIATSAVWPATPQGENADRLPFYVVNYDAVVAHAVTMKKRKKKAKKEKWDEEELEPNLTQMLSESAFYTVLDFMEGKKTIIGLDESTVIAQEDSLRFLYCNEAGKKAEYRRLLTGTPIPHRVLDLYGQLLWLGKEVVNKMNKWHFRNKFCILGGYKNKQVVGYRNLDILVKMYNTCSVRMKTEDVYDMPSRFWLPVTIKPDGKLMELYNQIYEEDILPVIDSLGEKHLLDVSETLTEFTRLWQVCGGTLLLPNGEYKVVHRLKIDALLHMIEEFGDVSTIVWHHFRAEGKEIVKALRKNGFKVGEYNGDLDKDERKEMNRAFENKEIRVLVIQDDSGHESITLNAAAHSVYFSNHSRMKVRIQSERRNWRIGQKKPVFYYDLVMKGLFDDWQSGGIKRRRGLSERVTDNKLNGNDIKGMVFYEERKRI